jgi:hypothetical protein
MKAKAAELRRFQRFLQQCCPISLHPRLGGGEGGIRKSLLIPKSLLAKSLKAGPNLIVEIVAVTI